MNIDKSFYQISEDSQRAALTGYSAPAINEIINQQPLGIVSVSRGIAQPVKEKDLVPKPISKGVGVDPIVVKAALKGYDVADGFGKFVAAVNDEDGKFLMLLYDYFNNEKEETLELGVYQVGASDVELRQAGLSAGLTVFVALLGKIVLWAIQKWGAASVFGSVLGLLGLDSLFGGGMSLAVYRFGKLIAVIEGVDDSSIEKSPGTQIRVIDDSERNRLRAYKHYAEATQQSGSNVEGSDWKEDILPWNWW